MIPAYNKMRCAAFPFETGIDFRRKTDFFPEEDTTKSYSGFEPEPTRLQAEGHSHHTGWATVLSLHIYNSNNIGIARISRAKRRRRVTRDMTTLKKSMLELANKFDDNYNTGLIKCFMFGMCVCVNETEIKIMTDVLSRCNFWDSHGMHMIRDLNNYLVQKMNTKLDASENYTSDCCTLLFINNSPLTKLIFQFQQDGATCHTARATIDLLKDTFGDRLISRFGPVNWPPRSCDLTPLDYFLWGYVKSLVYADKPQTLDHLEDNIRRVIADIRPQMLEKVIENWTFRLDYIRASRSSPMPEIIFKM
ncbi:uncharacterized protein TNCV_2868961 [Trichonephila clavipes]|nr:uncharacterized protein TNCV_2868961 [Trichonephila clavipes]